MNEKAFKKTTYSIYKLIGSANPTIFFYLISFNISKICYISYMIQYY